jgi:hypothetical protein
LKPGLDADLVVVDDEGNLFQTWKFGEKVFDIEEEEEAVVEEEDEAIALKQPQQRPKRLSLAHIEQFKEAISYGEMFAHPDTPISRVMSTGVNVF